MIDIFDCGRHAWRIGGHAVLKRNGNVDDLSRHGSSPLVAPVAFQFARDK
jgi:hypothetical protein